MSYGQQLNFFAAKARKYGSDWRGLVMCKNSAQLKCAAEDALSFIRDAKWLPTLQVLALANGARLYFRVADTDQKVQAQTAGREYTQIVWIGAPLSDCASAYARASLRSTTVPREDWRYETGVCM